MANMETGDLKVLWTVGTLEKLANLGLVSNVPYGLDLPSLEVYNVLDPGRLFPEDSDLLECLHSFLKENTPSGLEVS